MKTIYKYELTGPCEIYIPEYAAVLKCGVQDEKIIIWCLVETDRPTEKRCFSIVGTGQFINDTKKLVYIDTVFIGRFVWHVFEII